MDSIKEYSSTLQETLKTNADITGCKHVAEITNEHNDHPVDNKGSDNSAALDSADLVNTLLNIELNTVIDKCNQDNNTLVYNSNDTHNVNEINDPIPKQEEEEDDFGSFDSEGNEDDFGSFDDDFNNTFEETSSSLNTTQSNDIVNNTPIFNTLEEAIQAWETFLDQLYHSKQLDSFTKNAPKSIKKYVLEDAPESLHVHLTWDSVTRYMDNDTGVVKVKWYQSEIEKLHLNALTCKRSTTPNGLTMIDTTSMMVQDDLEPLDTFASTAEANNTFTSPTKANYTLDTVVQSPSIIIGSNNPTSPTSTTSTTPILEKRSSVFGFTSLSRFLPNLTKSDLPKSPTSLSPSVNSVHSNFEKNSGSPTNQRFPPSPLTPSNSTARRNTTTSGNTYHNDLDSLQGAMNHMNTGTEVSHGLRRSNTVAFSSRYKNSSIIVEDDDDHVSTPDIISTTSTKPRPTSFSGQRRVETQKQNNTTDLFDLDELVGSISYNKATPLKVENNGFKPLVPTMSNTPLSPTIVSHSNVRRNTVPVSAHSEVKRSFVSFDDDDFGDFTAQNNSSLTANKSDDATFGDFFGGGSNASSSAAAASSNVSSANNKNSDPFDLDSMMVSASHSRSKSTSSAVFSMLSPTPVLSPTPPKSPMFSNMQPLSPVIPSSSPIAHQTSGGVLSPTMITKDAPVSSPSSTVAYDPFDFSAINNSSSLASVFSVPAAVNDQSALNITAAEKEEDDDDWGDWES